MYDKVKVSQIQPKGFDKLVRRMKDGQQRRAQKLSDFLKYF